MVVVTVTSVTTEVDSNMVCCSGQCTLEFTYYMDVKSIHMVLGIMVTAISVTLRLGVRLNLRFLSVVLVLGFLLLPPVTQIHGKRVFRVVKRIDGGRRCGGTLQADSVI